MFTRSAIFEGRIHEGQEEAFYTAIQERMLPIWQSLPHAIDVRLYRLVKKDDDAPAIFLIQEIDYPSMEAIEEAMNSPARERAQVAHEKIKPMYSGRHFHVISRKLTTEWHGSFAG